VPDDLKAAVEYYEAISPALANRFRDVVTLKLHQIRADPESFPFDERPTRFANLGRFPYVMFFTADAQAVTVIGVLHGASDPDRWRSRRP
jgi:toxin ParE1/3/4